MKREEYKRMTEKRAGRSPIGKNGAAAFLVGGSLSLLGQALLSLYTLIGADEKTAALLVAVSLVFLSVLLTALGVYDRIARVAGAGTLVPITGFANAVASPALDTRGEGLILGVGSKIFTVAGPVLLYAVLAGSAYGVLFWLFQL